MTRAHIEFPDYHYTEDFREGAAIGGKFGITAVLPTIHDIREWKEGRRRFSRGYYRLVDGPDLQRLQQGLASHFEVRHALAFCSMQSALLELLELLDHPLEMLQYLRLSTNRPHPVLVL